MSAASIAASWDRPYTSVQWAWVRALGVEPSSSWRDEPRRARKAGAGHSRRDIRDCFANRRRVDLDDRS